MSNLRFDNKNKFEDLEVWQKAHKLTMEVYKITNKFPKEEKYRLGDQLRRSAASVATNIIVEGNSRKHKKEFQQFLNMARSSLEETKYHLLLARDLGYVQGKVYHSLQERSDQIGRMVYGLVKFLSIKSDIRNQKSEIL
jgi:four helix bundle protein